MKILLLAPQPFYQERGTPIAVSLLLQVLAERGDQVDVLTYHEGRDVSYDRVVIHRIAGLPFIHGIRPGFSWKKLICDILMFFKAITLVSRNKYHLVHAVEESAFIALVLKLTYKLPYVYDMDSSLPQQLIDRYPLLCHLERLLSFLEGCIVRQAEAVLTVCDDLANFIAKYQPKNVQVLRDVSLLEEKKQLAFQGDRLRGRLGIPGLLLLYVGNLEAYQGIDLLLESFALLLKKTDRADLVIIGGGVPDIQKYKGKARDLNIQGRVHFLGPKPLGDLQQYLAQADVLVSPRMKGNNTPMKIYSYLHSGKAVLATDLPTHTQVLDRRVAMLAEPVPEGFSEAMMKLITDETLRSELGNSGRRLVEKRHSFGVFRRESSNFFDQLVVKLNTEGGVGLTGTEGP